MKNQQFFAIFLQNEIQNKFNHLKSSRYVQQKNLFQYAAVCPGLDANLVQLLQRKGRNHGSFGIVPCVALEIYIGRRFCWIGLSRSGQNPGRELQHHDCKGRDHQQLR